MEDWIGNWNSGDGKILTGIGITIETFILEYLSQNLQNIKLKV